MKIYSKVFILAFALGVTAAAGPAAGAMCRGVILESAGRDTPRVVAGDARLVEKPACPASVFKLVIAWAGLETGVLTPETRIACDEPRIASACVEIGMRDALLRSSNRFFEVIAERLGRVRLTEFASRSGLFREPLPETWLGAKLPSAVWGGTLRTTPARLHVFTQRIAAGDVGSASVSRALEAAIEWPCGTATVRVFGKSGTMRKAVWFTGYGRSGDGAVRCVTVFLEGGLERRPEAAAMFFDRFGMRPPEPPPLGDGVTMRERGR
ncbi:MAG TPA: penicillin-binding transpeptidase domain-containing protein [Candidatus Ozemobacteraceae bacterium]